MSAFGCWEWNRYRNEHGYGRLNKAGQRTMYAHRWAYELLVGPIPVGLTIDHLCLNPACVNPEHLEPVTLSENRRRANSHVDYATAGRRGAEARWGAVA